MPENFFSYGLSKTTRFIFHLMYHYVDAVPRVLYRILALPRFLLDAVLGDRRLLLPRGDVLLIQGKYDRERRTGGRFMPLTKSFWTRSIKRAFNIQHKLPAEVNPFDCFGFEYSRDPIKREQSFSDETYYGAPYGSHGQTLIASFIHPSIRKSYLGYDRQVIKSTYDGNRLYLDWRLAPGYARHANETDKKPAPVGVLAVIPGLASHSHSNYIQHFVLHANAEGFHVVVCNARGMGNSTLDVPCIAAACFIEDLRTELGLNGPLSPDALAEKFGRFPIRRAESDAPGAPIAEKEGSLPLLAVGFSLGAAMLSRYLGIVREDTAVHAAAAVCAPWIFSESRAAMERPFARLTYAPALVSGLHRVLLKHSEVFLKCENPNIRAFVERVRRGYRCKSVTEFDINFTAPLFEFPSVEAYYEAATPIGLLHKVEVPLLCLSADDDPICGEPPHLRRWMTIADCNPNILYVLAPRGGHLGFCQSPLSELFDRPNWMNRRIVAALKHAAPYQYIKARRDVPEELVI